MAKSTGFLKEILQRYIAISFIPKLHLQSKKVADNYQCLPLGFTDNCAP